jgi:hypothetical protein
MLHVVSDLLVYVVGMKPYAASGLCRARDAGVIAAPVRACVLVWLNGMSSGYLSATTRIAQAARLCRLQRRNVEIRVVRKGMRTRSWFEWHGRLPPGSRNSMPLNRPHAAAGAIVVV